LIGVTVPITYTIRRQILTEDVAVITVTTIELTLVYIEIPLTDPVPDLSGVKRAVSKRVSFVVVLVAFRDVAFLVTLAVG
jgi:hypothetical protein